MAMKFFKKSTDQLILFSSSETTDFDHRLQYQKSSTRANTLTHVMHLFEEKNKYPPTVVDGPLPIKANGAIVVHRPSNRQSQIGTVRSLPLYLQDEPVDDDDFEQIIISKGPTAEEETDISDMKMIMITDESISSSSNNIEDGTHSSSIIEEEEAEDMNMIDLVHEENKRLRQQILLEREQHEHWRSSQAKLQQELTFAKNTIKNMERVTNRFQKLLLPTTTSRSFLAATTANKKSRRQSTGVTFDYYNTSQQHIITSYERKLQILLNEIDAMEIQEKELVNELTIQQNQYDKLNRKLKHKDDIIRQLSYDLQFERKLK